MVFNRHNQHGGTKTERIPALMQAVFLQSNRGKDVHVPPPERMGDKTYFQNWIFRRQTKEAQLKKVYKVDRDKILTQNKGSRTRGDDNVSLASFLSDGTRQRENKKAPEPKPKLKAVDSAPQDYFNMLLGERGYVIQTFSTLETAYRSDVTELQESSYGPRMVQIVRSNDADAMRSVMDGGLSPNPCNKFGESLVHMVCRKGLNEVFHVLLEAGASMQVSDDYGRTPMHDACWSNQPSFTIVSAMLDIDTGLLFLKDKRGSLPLTYVAKHLWQRWNSYFDEVIDKYFPASSAATYIPSDLSTMPPNSFPLPEPKTPLTSELIKMVANGDMTPEQARILSERDDETIAATVLEEDSDSDYEDDSDFDSDFDSDEDSDSEFDEDEHEEMLEMLHRASAGR